MEDYKIGMCLILLWSSEEKSIKYYIQGTKVIQLINTFKDYTDL